MKPQLCSVAQLSKRLSPLLAAPIALLLNQGQAKAMLNVNIFDEGSNLKVTVTGSISAGNAGTIAAATDQCYSNGALTGQSSILHLPEHMSALDMTYHLFFTPSPNLPASEAMGALLRIP